MLIMAPLIAAATSSLGMPGDFFTWASFGSLIGLSGVTYVVTNTAKVALNFNPKWFGLVVAIVATEIGVYLSHPMDPITYLLGALNGCLVFLTAAGGASTGQTQTAASRGADVRAEVANASARPPFLAPWF